MDALFSEIKNEALADTENISFYNQDESARECDYRCNHCTEGNKYHNQYANEIAECITVFKCVTEKVLECLKEYPGAEHLISTFSCMLSSDIKRLENLLQHKCSDLEEIKEEICFIKSKSILIDKLINSQSDDLYDIKKELQLIENQLSNIKCGCSNMTSGSIIVEDPQTTKVLVAVKNKNLVACTVRVRVLRDDVCPAGVLEDKCLLVSGCCSNAIIVSLCGVASYEIEVFGLVPGITVSSIELDKSNCRIKCSRLTFSQFFCLTEDCS